MQRDDDLDRVLDEAFQLPPDARQAFLDTRCGDDPEIRQAVEELLRDKDRRDPLLKPGGVFDGPLWEDLLAEPGELSVGAHLGPYEILGAIGAGGMGEVYRAHDTRLSRDVAIKVLPAAAGNSDALARFEREARAIAALSHPNILAIHDVGADGRLHFVVTELLDGQTLREKLAARGSLAPAEAVGYGIQLARGLAAAHDRGIVHRDLKPDNIFVTSDGRVKILDFGIALFDHVSADTAAHAPITRTGLVLGTVGYMSPEQLFGRPATPRSDLFAFGVVMHELIAGVHPFRRATVPEMQTAILREDPSSLAGTAPGVPPSIVRVIERCLEKEPAQRPESARDLAMFFEALGEPASAAVPAFTRDDGSVRLWRIRFTAASCAVLALTMATLGYVRVATDRAARETVTNDLRRAERVTRHLQEEQRARITLTARLIASFPGLKAAFATDFATIRDFLLQYQQRTPGLPLLIAIGPDGTTLARTDDTATQPANDRDASFDALMAAQGDATIVAIGNRPSVAVAVALEAGSSVFGYLIAAEPLDQRFADVVSDATQDEIVLLTDAGVLASTLRTAQIPWPSLTAWRTSGGRPDDTVEVRIGAQLYAARELPLAKEPAVSAILVRSPEEALAAYPRMQRGLLLIELAVIVAAVAVALWLPRWLVGRERQRADAPRQRL
jgi:hypothetical protein